MQQTIGELIRQTRRQQNITQSELGGTHFSKSYVSAVERNKITASSEALSFFAEQLNQPPDYFTSLLQQVGTGTQMAVLNPTDPSTISDSALPDASLTLLDILLESNEFSNIASQYEVPSLSPEVINALPAYKQARYYFLLGQAAKKKQNLAAALYAFEYALALAPLSQQPAILDELGMVYYMQQAYQTASSYHQRALALLAQPHDDTTTRLRCKVELHCGDDYRSLGAYTQAYQHYEQARHYLRAEHDMQTAGLLYIGLGYCTYASIHQRTALTLPAATRASFEQMEREFQRAVSFLMQARSIYQVSGNRLREASVRLIIAATLLDFCTRERQMQSDQARDTVQKVFSYSTSLLNETEEQCRQALLICEDFFDQESVPPELDTTIYMALAYLVRMLLQRAIFARRGGHNETAFRERALASYLCQHILDSLPKSSLPWNVIRHALSLPTISGAYQDSALPRLPELSEGMKAFPHNPLSLVEVYFAAGEIAEELARLTTSEEYCENCHAHAIQCYRAALRAALPMKEHDHYYVVRCYQRCACLLEERLQSAPEQADQTNAALAAILAEAFSLLQQPTLPSTSA